MYEEPTLKNIQNPNFGKPPLKQNPLLKELGIPHVVSFDYMLEKGLNEAIKNLYPVQFELPSGDKLSLRISDASVNVPCVPVGTIGVKNQRIYPSECRERAGTYSGRMNIQVSWSLNGKEMPAFNKDVGDIPLMLKSSKCNLYGLNPKQLVDRKEHENEWGGYFIVKGHEKIIRMLLMTRRNFPTAIKRSGWKNRGDLFSDVGIQIRCVAEDQTATSNVLHFVTDGTAKLMFSNKKVLYYAPLILIMKCLCDYNDHYIYQRLIAGYEDDLYYSSCIQNMLRNLHQEDLHTFEECKSYVGKMFRIKFWECPTWFTDIQVTDFILNQCILIHLRKPEDKFNTLVFMTQKLFAFAQDRCKVEGADAVMMQELLLGGHLYLQILKEKMQSWLLTMKAQMLKRIKTSNKYGVSASDVQAAAKYSGDFAETMEHFLATGSIKSMSGLGLMQDKGLTIVAENINRMRYMSHFRAVHRGSFFQEMRTTEARQLLPDAWGFICPVHTPDGAPCGLLNHLTMNCQVTDVPVQEKLKNLPKVLVELGMVPLNSLIKTNYKDSYTVLLDGRVLGYVHKNIIGRVTDMLRIYKIRGDRIPNTTEIVLVPKKGVAAAGGAQFPGLFLFTGPARLMRPLVNLAAKQIELVGTFEQVYLNVCVVPEEAYSNITTHMELSKTAFMSNLAQLIPMPDNNQSPRNMYQCQMGKQTMGSPLHTWTVQAETKMYRLQTPATPLFRPVHYDNVDLDDFAMGTNAIVAVISYTGYDMEDAMIINKSSFERGLAHGSVYKSEFITLEDMQSYFCRDPTNSDLEAFIDTDGLPHPGAKITTGVPLYCYFDADQSRYVVKKYSGKEECVVDNVRLCGGFGNRVKRMACIIFRIQRNPSVGDKFASRAGQKGICSQKWPSEDLPFTETGLVPDIVFNPHGFPSRMTIAMMIEVMAGKSAAIHGLVHDATPFKFDEENTAIDYFGKLLESGGYNYYGTETMYSGIDGREMTAQIFFGIVHYQRLRHMVSDKWQVRSTGPLDVFTRQPLKGRRRGGGVRFGEMERDSLISHGAAFLLQDRLFHCSDETTAFICNGCKTLLGPVTVVTRLSDKAYQSETKESCRLCGNGDKIAQIKVPYIFKLLVTQLASVNLNVKIDCESV